MGAANFTCNATGKTMAEAFSKAVADAQWEHGHGGYTGTIAEKGEFRKIVVPDGMDVDIYIEALFQGECPPGVDPVKFNLDHVAINDKWGPAGGIDLLANDYVFFGWASS